MAARSEATVRVVRKPEHGLWIDRLHDSIGKSINLETHDGSRRDGRITAITNRDIMVNGERCFVLGGIEINGDPSDVIDVSIIQSMEIR